MDQRNAGEHAGPVLAIPVHNVLRAVERGVGPAGAPERRVDPRVELVMDGEKVANVVPLIAVVTVVKPDERRRRFTQAVEQ